MMNNNNTYLINQVCSNGRPEYLRGAAAAFYLLFAADVLRGFERSCAAYRKTAEKNIFLPFSSLYFRNAN